MKQQYIAVKTPDGDVIRFRLYEKEAPATSKAFVNALPIEASGRQARFAGHEIWVPDGPELNIPQENATIMFKPGELGYAAPVARNRGARSIVIVYGEARLSECANVFGMVLDEDIPILKKLGEKIWLEGAQILHLEAVSEE